MESDHIVRAYARLSALKEQLDQMATQRILLEGEYVDEYHDALRGLQASGFDLGEFQFASEHVRQSAGFGPRGAVDPPLLIMKVAAVLKYFQIRPNPTEAERPAIGFVGPKRQSEAPPLEPS